ncbi:hypothetical protein PR048_031275 [Dryococelus australis]|uniref:Uncharacterized protein n=1 Tax=Dryococelus australis TaxID=614101 RepID=A0ABQ9G4S4_9NEOP|nr:hypothetical protein PR048_031275 [Dryococelus australis]
MLTAQTLRPLCEKIFLYLNGRSELGYSDNVRLRFAGVHLRHVRPTWVKWGELEQRRNERKGGGDGRSPTSGIVRHDYHLRKSGVNRPGIEPGSPWWEASGLTAQPPWARSECRKAKFKSTNEGRYAMVATNFELCVLEIGYNRKMKFRNPRSSSHRRKHAADFEIRRRNDQTGQCQKLKSGFAGQVNCHDLADPTGSFPLLPLTTPDPAVPPY